MFVGKNIYSNVGRERPSTKADNIRRYAKFATGRFTIQVHLGALHKRCGIRVSRRGPQRAKDVVSLHYPAIYPNSHLCIRSRRWKLMCAVSHPDSCITSTRGAMSLLSPYTSWTRYYVPGIRCQELSFKFCENRGRKPVKNRDHQGKKKSGKKYRKSSSQIAVKIFQWLGIWPRRKT